MQQRATATNHATAGGDKPRRWEALGLRVEVDAQTDVPGLVARQMLASSSTIIKHLDRYLISEQVEIADQTKEYAQVYVAGPDANSVILKLGLPEVKPFEQRSDLPCAGTVLTLRRNDLLGVPGYDLIFPPAQGGSIWQCLVQAGAWPSGLETYNVLRVEAGTPVYGVDIDDERFVVEVNRPRAICYTKGCYIGQEPIVMARDRGHVNRWLVGVKVPGTRSLAAGAKLFRDGAEVGQVTSAVFSPRLGMALALAYVRRGSQEPGTTLEIEADGGRCSSEVVSLPVGSGT